MEVIRKKLKEKKGSTSIVNVSVIIIVGMMLFSLFFEYFHLYRTLGEVTNQIEQTIIKTATHNYYNVYKGIREGNSSAHDYAGNDMWVAMVSTEDVEAGLVKTLKLKRDNNNLIKDTESGALVYNISNVQSQVTNVDVGTLSPDDVKLTFHTTADVIIPIRFMGLTINTVKKVSIDSHFIPRY